MPSWTVLGPAGEGRTLAIPQLFEEVIFPIKQHQVHTTVTCGVSLCPCSMLSAHITLPGSSSNPFRKLRCHFALFTSRQLDRARSLLQFSQLVHLLPALCLVYLTCCFSVGSACHAGALGDGVGGEMMLVPSHSFSVSLGLWCGTCRMHTAISEAPMVGC